MTRDVQGLLKEKSFTFRPGDDALEIDGYIRWPMFLANISAFVCVGPYLNVLPDSGAKALSHQSTPHAVCSLRNIQPENKFKTFLFSFRSF